LKILKIQQFNSQVELASKNITTKFFKDIPKTDQAIVSTKTTCNLLQRIY